MRTLDRYSIAGAAAYLSREFTEEYSPDDVIRLGIKHELPVGAYEETAFGMNLDGEGSEDRIESLSDLAGSLALRIRKPYSAVAKDNVLIISAEHSFNAEIRVEVRDSNAGMWVRVDANREPEIDHSVRNEVSIEFFGRPVIGEYWTVRLCDAVTVNDGIEFSLYVEDSVKSQRAKRALAGTRYLRSNQLEEFLSDYPHEPRVHLSSAYRTPEEALAGDEEVLTIRDTDKVTVTSIEKLFVSRNSLECYVCSWSNATVGASELREEGSEPSPREHGRDATEELWSRIFGFMDEVASDLKTKNISHIARETWQRLAKTADLRLKIYGEDWKGRGHHVCHAQETLRRKYRRTHAG